MEKIVNFKIGKNNINPNFQGYFISHIGVKKSDIFENNRTMWRYFQILPILNRKNIISLGEGQTPLIRVESLERLLNGAKLYCKNECVNPGGTFKDREASYVISKAKESGYKNLVFHSTGNTGYSYCLYAKKAGIDVWFFLPLSCLNKCDKKMLGKNVHIIAVDGGFKTVGAIAKKFAKANNFTAIAPLHDKLEGKKTIAYEQFEELPEATIFVQTIAGGYGVIGFYEGHKILQKLGLEKSKMPKIFCVQSKDGATIEKLYNNKRRVINANDIIATKDIFEKTLQSTNPLSTYGFVKNALDNSDGEIVSVDKNNVSNIQKIFYRAMKKSNIQISYRNEKSPFISFAGLLKLSKAKKIKKSDVIYLLITGRGRGNNEKVKPDAIVRPTTDDYKIITATKKVKKYL